MESVSLYTETRNEYMKQLSTWIVPPLVEFFRTEYDRIAKKEGRKAMGAFQGFCAEVPRWNQDVIDANIGVVLDNCRCDYVEELMTAVFIAHTKMLTAIRVSTKQKKLSITLPKLDHFLHRVFVECARAFWKAPFLFSDELSLIEKQKNILQAETMCVEALSGAVRSLLPVKSILRDYLDEEEDEKPATETQAQAQAHAQAQAETETQDSDSDEETYPAAIPAISENAAAVIAALKAAPQPEPQTIAAAPAAAPSAAAPAPVPVTIEKLETPPAAPVISNSSHEVKEVAVNKPGVQIEKADVNLDPPKLMIETEPSVHFTPYDTVFDETKPGISEIQYNEKVSVEDKPPSNWGMFDDDEEEDVPKLEFLDDAEVPLDGGDIEDLEKPVVAVAPAAASATQDDDDDHEVPLAETGEFETL